MEMEAHKYWKVTGKQKHSQKLTVSTILYNFIRFYTILKMVMYGCVSMLPPSPTSSFCLFPIPQHEAAVRPRILDCKIWLWNQAGGLFICLGFFFPRVQCKSVKAKICYSAEQQNILISVKFVSGGKQTLSSFYTQKLYNYNASLKY